MAKAQVNQIMFDGIALREPGEAIDLDPKMHYSPSGNFTYVDPQDQRIAEQAYRSRLNNRFESQIQSEIEAQIAREAEARMHAEAEARVKARSGANGKEV
jgi:hypothetical protein